MLGKRKEWRYRREGSEMTRRIYLFVLMTCFGAALAYSRPEEEGYTRIARLSYIEGNVSFQHGSEVDWSAASINMPLEPGDRIYTGGDGRAEIQFDDGSAFRLAENTDVEILSLDEKLIQLRMMLGLATLTVAGDADFEVDTPAAAFNPTRNGVYRFDVIENGDTDAIVRKGELEAANNDFSERIRSGELLHLRPEQRERPRVSEYDRRDSFDEWNDRRTADIKAYGNVRYLPDNVYAGASDLDRYGRWVNVDTYGTAWLPYQTDDSWSPYSVGRWCYRPLYGWTWISYEPWGWLPYHYGSWYRNSLYGWCWIPGPAYSFNFWSPALVTFYNGPGWISWCPLGPGDYYDVRHYHYRGIYSHQLAELGRLHWREPGNPVNREVRGAFRTAQLDQFRNGSFDTRARNSRWGNVDRPWSEGTLVRGSLPVQPTTASFRAAPDRPVVRPGDGSSLPSVVRSVPGRDAANQSRFRVITNPSTSPRVLRNQTESGGDGRNSNRGTRTIQGPQNPSSAAPARQENQGNSRWQNNRGNNSENNNRSGGLRSEGNRGSGNENNNRSREGSGNQGNRSPGATPSDRGKSPQPRNERYVPDQKPAPQSAPSEARPRSEYRQNYSSGAARSSAPAVRSFGPGAAQTYRAPQPWNGSRWGNGNTGAVRSPEPARPQEYSAPRQPSPSFERGGGSRPAAPQAAAPRASGRSASEGNSRRGR
jgi:hypothetical protein